MFSACYLLSLPMLDGLNHLDTYSTNHNSHHTTLANNHFLHQICFIHIYILKVASFAYISKIQLRVFLPIFEPKIVKNEISNYDRNLRPFYKCFNYNIEKLALFTSLFLFNAFFLKVLGNINTWP